MRILVIAFICSVTPFGPAFCPANATAEEARVERETETKKKVEDRSSSKAALAKGEINFDDLKFDIEKDAPFEKKMLNEKVESLHGRKVKIRGYILPATLFQQTNIKQFVLVRDNQECCFGPGAALYDCICVQMAEGKSIDFVVRPVTVEGKFSIEPEKYKYPGGAGPRGASHFAIFEIEGVRVE